ncbi:MAG: hypothetical protein O2985_17465 [Proteobacteria bacterium]|nr:hypothetical protein [Pseudomonadota bacterium]
MLRLHTIAVLIFLGLTPPAAAAPAGLFKMVMQLADAVGILSSRSCRNDEKAEFAAQALSYLLLHAERTKHMDYATGRRYRRDRVIPLMQTKRGLTHSSRDCSAAEATVVGIVQQWNLNPSVLTARATEARSAGEPSDSTAPAKSVIGAAQSDTLSFRRLK